MADDDFNPYDHRDRPEETKTKWVYWMFVGWGRNLEEIGFCREFYLVLTCHTLVKCKLDRNKSYDGKTKTSSFSVIILTNNYILFTEYCSLAISEFHTLVY